MHRSKLFFCICLFLLTQVLCAQPFQNGFHFNLPAEDSSTQRFLPTFNASPITDFVFVNNNGQFQAGTESLRFWGVNFTTGACFPLKEKASMITARMNKMGINLVRFHHMDNPWTNQDGTLLDRSFPHTRSLHPVSLDRMFYLLTQMKRNGVYANMNLHVSRTFTEADGVIYADSIGDFGKGVTYFDPYLIALQKEYATQLLGTVNPYTGQSLANDPVMAMVEITNENTLYGMWRSSQLQPFSEGGTIIKRHANLLNDLWQTFLIQKYHSDSFLQAAWDFTAGSGVPENIVLDGGFESGNPGLNWIFEMHNGAAATLIADDEEVYSGNYSGKIEVLTVTGTDWHLQFKQSGGSVEKDSVYSFEFWAKADRQRQISASLMRNNAPYTYYGGQSFQLDTIWKDYSFSITPPESNTDALRITFGFNNETGPVWLDDIRVGRQKLEGLLANESLLQSNVRRNPFSERHSFSPKRIADLAEFYVSIQKSYYDEMYHFLRDSLGVKVPITGTNALSGQGDVMSMQTLDYIDDHAYWNHPQFPNQAWSSWDWLISNNAMLKNDHLGNIPGLFGGLRMYGKPYTVSEYNHPFPNVYRTEMMPIMAAYLSFHDADGIMFFQYEDSHEDWEEDRVPGFFSINRDPAVMALSPIFGNVYRKRMLQSGTPTVINYSADYLYQSAVNESPFRWHKNYGYNTHFATEQSAAIGNFDSTGVYFSNNIPSSPNGTIFKTSTQEISSDVDKGIFVIESPQFVSLSGFLSDTTNILTGPLALLESDGFGVLAWMSLEETPLNTSTESILVLSSRAQNTGMLWDGNQTLHNNWGESPTEIEALKVSLQLRLNADSIRIYPLDVNGEEEEFFTLYPNSSGDFDVQIDQNIHRTTWFGVETFLETVSNENISEEAYRIGPIPTSDVLHIWSGKGSLNATYEIYNIAGQELKSGRLRGSHSISVRDLPKGIYFLNIDDETSQEVFRFIRQ